MYFQVGISHPNLVTDIICYITPNQSNKSGDGAEGQEEDNGPEFIIIAEQNLKISEKM